MRHLLADGGTSRGVSPSVFRARASVHRMRLGDFLVECRCRNGHTSSIAYRGFARVFVELAVRLLSPSCGWDNADGETCGEELVHTIHVLGASDVHEEAERARWRADTAPGMPLPELPYPTPRSSMPPPMPEDVGPITGGE